MSDEWRRCSATLLGFLVGIIGCSYYGWSLGSTVEASVLFGGAWFGGSLLYWLGKRSRHA